MGEKELPQKRLGSGPGKEATQFKPGNKANPGGRPKAVAEVQALAREYTTKAIEGLASIASKGKSEAARVAAWNSLLDRAWGKAPQRLDVAQVPQKMTREQLSAIIAEEEKNEHEA